MVAARGQETEVAIKFSKTAKKVFGYIFRDGVVC